MADPTCVLLVDPNDTVRYFTAEVLTRRAFSVLQAQSGAEAWRIGSVSGRAIDVLVTDATLGDMTGLELLDRLRRTWPDLRAVLIGASNHPGEVALRKPYLPNALADAVDAVVG